MNKNIIGKSVHLYNGEYLAQLFSCCVGFVLNNSIPHPTVYRTTCGTTTVPVLIASWLIPGSVY